MVGSVPARFRWTGLLLISLITAFCFTSPAGAKTDDIRARCDGDKPVILARPAGTEHITVICVDGLPEYMVNPPEIPAYDPVRQPLPQVVPPDFGGWVTVWLNGHPLKTLYNPIRGVQEPNAYLAASTGRVMMPVRFFTEAFGGIVLWSQPEKRVQLAMPGRPQQLQVWVSRPTAAVGTASVTLDQPPVLFADRVFVPVRFLTESLGAKVEWDRFNKSVRVQLDGADCISTTYCGEVR